MNKINTGAKQSGVFLTRVLAADGSVKQDWSKESNTSVNQGLAYMNNTSFQRGGIAPKSTWYIGIYEGNLVTDNLRTSTAASVAADTTEVLDTNYDETGRIPWTINDASGINDDLDRVISNSVSPANFTMSATKTIRGAFLCSDSSSGGTSGTAILYSLSNFDLPRNTQPGDILQVIYDSTLTS